MNKLLVSVAAAATLATTASAATLQPGDGDGFGFFMVDGVEDGATEINWTNGFLKLLETVDLLTLEISGRDALTEPLTAWAIDFSEPYATTEKFDIYLNPDFNAHCDILVTPIVDDWNTGNQNLTWNEGNTSDGGFCSTGNGATLTADLATMPLPAGPMLLLTGFAGFAAMRRMR